MVTLSSCKEEDPIEPAHEHFDAVGMVLLNSDSTVFLNIFEGMVQSENKEINLKINDSTDFYIIKFLDENGNLIEVPDEEHKTFSWDIADHDIFQINFKNENGWFISFKGLNIGTTNVVFKIMHEDHNDFKTPAVPVIVE